MPDAILFKPSWCAVAINWWSISLPSFFTMSRACLECLWPPFSGDSNELNKRTDPIFSGSLSTMSSVINSLSAITWTEYVRPFFRHQPTERTVTLLTKLISLGYGIAATAMAFNAESLGGILNALVSGLGAINGPKLGLFMLGVWVPRANAYGAITGVISGSVVAMWMFIFARIYPEAVVKLPLSVQQCSGSNQSLTTSTLSPWLTTTSRSVPASGPFNVYAMSFFYLAALGCIVTFVVGVLASLMIDAVRSRSSTRVRQSISKSANEPCALSQTETSL
jgi:Na+/proline symporter